MLLERPACKLTSPKRALDISFYNNTVIVQPHKHPPVAQMRGNSYLRGRDLPMTLRVDIHQQKEKCLLLPGA